mgnify:CR=1 FL=1
MPIPFETPRCRIRPFEEGDIEAFMSYRNNLDWMRFQGFKGKKYLEYKAALLMQTNFNTGVQLAVGNEQSGGMLGDLYLKLEKSVAWIGYTIAPQHARQGFAFEVVTQLLLELKQAGLTLVKAGVEEQNLASIALLRKLGFVQVGTEDRDLIFHCGL